MPISDQEPYPVGHFRRVFDHLIAPACEKAGYRPVLGSDVKETNLIVLDILRRLHRAEMVLCDLSGRNPNVLFELGFRQAFNRPVTLIKDDISERIFDISALRDITYDHSLRVDTVGAAVDDIAARMHATHEASQRHEPMGNSLVQLLGIDAASIPTSPVSTDTKLLLGAIQGITDRIREVELRSPKAESDAVRGRFSNESQMVEVVVRGEQEYLDSFINRLSATRFVGQVGIALTDINGVLVPISVAGSLAPGEVKRLLFHVALESGVELVDVRL